MKTVLFGFGNDAKSYLDNFSGLKDKVDQIFDTNIELDTLYEDIPVSTPKMVSPDNKYVIASHLYFAEIYNELIQKYKIPKKHIQSANEWILELLASKEVSIRPVKVRLDLCTLCQLDCAYCYMRTGNYGKTGRGYVTAETFENFLLKNPFVKEIELSNSGEIFLNPELERILELAKKYNIACTIGNGTNFNTVPEGVMRLLVDLPVRFINISIDGASQDTYSVYRRGGDYNRVIDNIKRLNVLKKEKGSCFPELQWQFIMMEHNEEDIEEARRMADELDMSISFKTDDIKSGFVPKDVDKIKHLTGKDYFSFQEYNRKHQKTLYSEFCKEMIFQPQINWDGRLLGCCMIWNDDLGENVFDIGLENALKGEKYMETVELLLGMKEYSQLKNPICKGCIVEENIRRKNFIYL